MGGKLKNPLDLHIFGVAVGQGNSYFHPVKIVCPIAIQPEFGFRPNAGKKSI